MNISDETPKREITISKEILKVPTPFEEGMELTEAMANVLNQTFAENIRNNFAPRVKSEQELAEKEGREVALSTLQQELDAYVAEYEFGAKRSGGVAVDPVKRIALVMIRAAIKKQLTAKGKDPKAYTAEQMAAFAERVYDEQPMFKELAQKEHDQKKAAAAELLSALGDLDVAA